MKIAPTIEWILRERESADLEPEALRAGREARRELRALLAVAHAHDRLLTYVAGYIAATGHVRRDIWAEFPVLAKSLKARARLERVSRGASRKGKR